MQHKFEASEIRSKYFYNYLLQSHEDCVETFVENFILFTCSDLNCDNVNIVSNSRKKITTVSANYCDDVNPYHLRVFVKKVLEAKKQGNVYNFSGETYEIEWDDWSKQFIITIKAYINVAKIAADLTMENE